MTRGEVGKPRALFVVPTTLADLKAKGVADDILDRDEGGFFSDVLTIHPFASARSEVRLGDRHRVVELPWGRAISGPRVLRWAWRSVCVAAAVLEVRMLVRRFSPTLVRSNDPYMCGLLGLVGVMRFRRPHFCVSIHADYTKRHELDPDRGAPMVGGNRSLALSLERLVLRRADMALPIRSSLAPRVADLSGAPDRVRVIPHSVHFRDDGLPTAAELRSMLGVEPSIPIVSFAGRMSKENYIFDVLRILELVGSEQTHVAVLMGEGPEEESVRQWIEERGVADSVRITGFHPRPVVMALRRESIASFCLMGGYSLIEACGMGSVPVAYDVEWHHELVRDGETGVLVAEGDVESAAVALRRLLSDPDAASRLGDSARRLARQRHSPETASRLRRDAYRSLLEQEKRTWR